MDKCTVVYLLAAVAAGEIFQLRKNLMDHQWLVHRKQRKLLLSSSDDTAVLLEHVVYIWWEIE